MLWNVPRDIKDIQKDLTTYTTVRPIPIKLITQAELTTTTLDPNTLYYVVEDNTLQYNGQTIPYQPCTYVSNNDDVITLAGSATSVAK